MPFLNDTLAGTSGADLATRVSESGHTWARHASRPSGVMLITAAGRARQSSGPAVYVPSWVPDGAEYIVGGRISRLTNQTATAGIGLVGRWTTSGENGYGVRINDPEADGSVVYELIRVDNSVVTVLGSWAGSLDASGGTVSVDVELRIRDAAKTVRIDGVDRITSADNTYTAAGTAGLRGGTTNQNETQGLQWDSVFTTDFRVQLPSVALSGASAMAGAGFLRRFLPAVALTVQSAMAAVPDVLRVVAAAIGMTGRSAMTGAGGFRHGLNPLRGLLAGEPVELTLLAPPGLLDVEPVALGVRIDHADGTPGMLRTTVGITEGDPDPYGYALYRVTVTLPDDLEGPCVIAWDAEDEDGPSEAVELCTVVIPARRAALAQIEHRTGGR